MQAAQKILGDINVVEDENSHTGPEENEICILKDHVWNKEYVRARIATSALFTYLSPMTRQPLAFNCNARRTLKSSVKTASDYHPSAYSTNLWDVEKQDGVSISSGRQTYYLVSSLVHQPGYDTVTKTKNQPPMDDFTHLRSMTRLDFGESIGTAESLILSDHGVRNAPLKMINQLLFLLRIRP